MQRIALNIDDNLLVGALMSMLEELGYLTQSNADGCEFVITDRSGGVYSGARVLFIGRENKIYKNYLRRPFKKSELKNAIVALTGEDEPEKHRGDGLRIDKKHRAAYFNGKRLVLTEKELALLTLLYENESRAVSDAEIVEKIWKNLTVSDSNIAAVYVNYLRKKLDLAVGKRLIIRVRGQGYMYKEQSNA